MRIISSGGFALPGAMGGENLRVAERLGSLHSAQRLAIGASGHEVTLSAGKAIHDGQHRDCPKMTLQSFQQMIDHFAGTVGACGVMDQHEPRRVGSERFQRDAD